jgi:hypothetical protein
MEIDAGDDRDAGVRLEVKQVVVIRNDYVRLAVHGAFENPVVVRVGRNDGDGRAGSDNAVAGDTSNAPYEFLDALVLPREIGAEHPGRLPDDGGRNQEAVTGAGNPPQDRVASLRTGTRRCRDWCRERP